MALMVIAFLLYLVGFVGVMIDGTGELWMWFLAAGLVLNLSLLLLSWLDSDKLKFIRESTTTTKASILFMILLTGLAAYHRLRANIAWFTGLLVIILVLWTCILCNLTKTWRKESSNE